MTESPSIAARIGTVVASPLGTSALGAYAWLVWVLWPMAAPAASTPQAMAASLAVPVCLGVGHWLGAASRRERHASARRAWLLLGVPVSLAVSAALQPASWQPTSAAFGLGMAAWLAYVAAAAKCCAERGHPMLSDEQPSGPSRALELPPHLRLTRGALTALMVFGALAVAVVAPWIGFTRGNGAAHTSPWGAADAQGHVLTAIVGGVLGFAIAGVYLGDMLVRPTGPARRVGVTAQAVPWGPVVLSALLSVLGMATYWLTR